MVVVVVVVAVVVVVPVLVVFVVMVIVRASSVRFLQEFKLPEQGLSSVMQ